MKITCLDVRIKSANCAPQRYQSYCKSATGKKMGAKVAGTNVFVRSFTLPSGADTGF